MNAIVVKKLVECLLGLQINLIMDKLVVKEFIQEAMTVENLKQELQELLTDEQRIKTLQQAKNHRKRF